MSRADYERPSEQQVNKIFKCRKCKREQEIPFGSSAQMPCPSCGGFVDLVGESYPGNPDDWDEVKQGYDINGPWVRKF